MWNWTIKFDKAFEIPTYRVKADGLIVGTIRKFGTDWSWEVSFPGQDMPVYCRGTCSTREQCQEAVKETVAALTKGLSRDEAIGMIVSGIYMRRPVMPCGRCDTICRERAWATTELAARVRICSSGSAN